MENISKALMMAGSFLIAVLIIGALLLMFNQIGTHEKGKSNDVKSIQVAEFNMDFEKYTDDTGIQGADIVSIVNKIVDYNKKSGITNSIDYDIKMSIKIDNLDSFRNKYAINRDESLFNNNSLIVSNGRDDLARIITKYTEYETNYGLPVMSKLASNYEKIEAKRIC